MVYADNDPLILAYARALLVGTPQGATAYLHTDLREPEDILAQYYSSTRQVIPPISRSPCGQ